MKESIKKYPFKDGLPHEFEFVDLSVVLQSKRNLLTTPHRAQFYHILWIEKGEGTHFIDFKPINIEDNLIVFVPHNCVNLYDNKGIYHGKSIIFTNNFFCKNDDDIKFLHSSMLFSDLYDVAKIHVHQQMHDLKIIMDAMEVEYNKTPDSNQYQILHNMLHIFLLQAEREMHKQGYKEHTPSINLNYLLLFKETLEKNFQKEKSVNKYASGLNISEKQLHKATTLLLDKTPKQIIDERIILEAKRLLIYSNHSVKEIAYNLGYQEPTNFIKYFRKHTHSTPTEFREQF